MACLIIKNDGIGDLILASGVISELGEYFGGEVDLVTCLANREIAEGINPLRKRIYVSRADLRFMRLPARFGILWSSITREDRESLRWLKTERYDIAICLRRFIRQSSLVVMKTVRAKRCYCAWQFPRNISRMRAIRASRGWERYESSPDILSEAVYYKHFLEKVIDVQIAGKPRLFYCQAANPSSSRTVALGLGGRSSKWPEDYWVELAGRLSSEGWHLLLLGGKDTTELANRIKFVQPTVDNCVGRLNWRDTAEVLESVQAFIGNDSGVTHFASLICKKCLVILGGGTFRRFFPWPENANQYVIYYGLECFDCGWRCQYAEKWCLKFIRPENVYRAFARMFECPPSEININEAASEYMLSWRFGMSPRIVDF